MPNKPNVSYVVKKDEPIERALRRFKRLCEHAGIQKLVKAKRHYEKPSDERRREMRKQERNRHRADRKAIERQQRKIDRARKQQRTIHKSQQDEPTTTSDAPAPAELETSSAT